MSDEDNNNMFFAAAPTDGDAPIVLEPPSDDPFAAPDYAADTTTPDAAFVGDVNEDAAVLVDGNDDDAVDGAALPSAEADDSATPAVPVSTDPTPMQIWNNGWMETLAVRKEEENSRKAELLEAARVDLAAFAAERESKRESSLAQNRQDEQSKLEAIEADLENDNSWQRVCKMVELQHDSSSASKDIKRMRDVMIMLKNDTAKAEGLAA